MINGKPKSFDVINRFFDYGCKHICKHACKHWCKHECRTAT